FYTSNACRNLNEIYGVDAYNYFQYQQAMDKSTWDDYRIKSAQDMLNPTQSNFLFSIQDSEGNILFSTYHDQNYGISANCGSFTTADGNTQRVIGYVREPLLPGDNYYQSAQLHKSLFEMRYTIILLGITALLLCLALFIFLLSSAGHKRNHPGISLNWLDKVPYDLYLSVVIPLLCITIFYGDTISFSDFTAMFIDLPFFVWLMLLILTTLLTTATRLKNGSLLHNTLIWHICSYCWRMMRKIFSGINEIIINLPALAKTIFLVGSFLLINIILFAGLFSAFSLGIWIPLTLLFYSSIFIFSCRLALQMHQLAFACQKIATGDMEYQVNTSKMRRELKSHGDNLNNISTGMAKAVEAKMKSERFKTELITNVSHDLKTPLTSIINYIDLLKKENIQSEQVNEYLVILDRQSAKLKKLTEDLVEASKASTGNINVNLATTDVVELLQQTVAEYQDKFTAAKLSPIVSINASNPYIKADGRLLWRIIDNLLNNVCKYSLPHTRVYFHVAENQNKILLTLKNISRDSLNISADELMERFVQGDSSRTAEGSGLGLSIARSLTELQKG
ncbi:MAG: HAMP domain-containing sensor histidine kinase, partial [Clostridiales bacterium]